MSKNGGGEQTRGPLIECQVNSTVTTHKVLDSRMKLASIVSPGTFSSL